MDKHEFKDYDAAYICDECGEPVDHENHDDPADALPDDLKDAAEAAIEALETLAGALRKAGGRDSDVSSVRYFSAYHLANVEGNDNGAGGLASNLLAALRDLVR